MHFFQKNLVGILCCILFANTTTYGWDPSETEDLRLSHLPYYSYGQGLGITSPDSLYQLKIRFRIQNRVSYQRTDGKNAVIDGEIRRLRLRFDGYVGDPRFQYTLQLSFAPDDVGSIEEGKNINVIRDAVIFYKPDKHWSFGFGQTKLPGNRQRVNSSGAIQFTDRTINNARFNIDRDFGVQVFRSHMFANKFSWSLKGAVTMGEGRNWTQNNDDNLAYTGKIELYPFGSFTKNGAYFEGDLMREATPKLLLSAAFHQNNDAKRTQGQLGADLYEPRTMQSVLIDMMFKYKGFALMSAYMSRSADNPITVNPSDPVDIRYVYVGSGVDIQGSYLFENNLEALFRYSTQTVGSHIFPYVPHTQQYAVGLTKYIWEHAFKLQSELCYQLEDFHSGIQQKSWYLRFQIEMGI